MSQMSEFKIGDRVKLKKEDFLNKNLTYVIVGFQTTKTAYLIQENLYEQYKNPKKDPFKIGELEFSERLVYHLEKNTDEITKELDEEIKESKK